MGPGPYDRVRIHRLVREYKPYRPLRTKGNVFMVHGGVQDFEDIFLRYGAETLNAKTSAAFYLSSNEIDVWGIDLAWNLVPLETADFEFMEGLGNGEGHSAQPQGHANRPSDQGTSPDRALEK